MTEPLINMFRKNGITKEAQILLNGIRYWDKINKKELKIYKDGESISYISGSEFGSFPYSDNIDTWPDKFIEVLYEVGAISV